MNLDAIRVVRDALRDNSIKNFTFDMNNVLVEDTEIGRNPCGTKGCIAGAAVLTVGGGKAIFPGNAYDSIAAKALDLTDTEMRNLFYPDDMFEEEFGHCDLDYDRITREHAIVVLTRLLDGRSIEDAWRPVYENLYSSINP